MKMNDMPRKREREQEQEVGRRVELELELDSIQPAGQKAETNGMKTMDLQGKETDTPISSEDQISMGGVEDHGLAGNGNGDGDNGGEADGKKQRSRLRLVAVITALFVRQNLLLLLSP